MRRAVRELRYRRLLKRLAGPRLVAAFADAYPDAFFIEIGANDGDQHDHLRAVILSHSWRGIMVEPVPYVFARLERNYAGQPGIVTDNVAVAERDGTLPFYHLAESGDTRLPAWYDAVGSFRRDAVLSHAREIPDVAERIRTAEVRALTFDSLCREHGVQRVDLLAIDTEGYDWEILRTIDLARWHPRLLIYEHYHLGDSDRAECRAYVEAAGYETMEEGFDTFCLDTASGDGLTEAWRRLSPAVAGVSAADE